MELRSYAKINLTLDILGKRGDGYHDIETVYQNVNIFDTIKLFPIEEKSIKIECNVPGLSNEENLCFKAAKIMIYRFNINTGVMISLDKKIPPGAGLSGGSSNAAAVIKGMNYIFNLNLGPEEMMDISAEIGMDVPFHVLGGTCIGRGRGEIVEKVKSFGKHYVVIVYPGFSINTPEAYSNLSYCDIGKARSTSNFLKSHDLNLLHNDFEYSILKIYPEILSVKKYLGNNSILSGSGSCVFGIYEDRGTAWEKYKLLKEMYRDVFFTETINKNIYYAEEMGICSGVRRALDGVSKIKDENGIYVLGSLVHNHQIIEELKGRGIKFISDYNEIEDGTIIISAHGVPDITINNIKKRGIKVIDLTCPFVKKLHRITKGKEKEGKKIIILGDENHTEVKGVIGNIKNYKVVKSIEDLDGNDFESKIALVSQTTEDQCRFEYIKNALRKKGKNVEIIDTICKASKNRQKCAVDLARRSDIMLVIGGKISANTTRLSEICSEHCHTRHIETEIELGPEIFFDYENVGITAGASTPDWVIDSLKDKIQKIL